MKAPQEKLIKALQNIELAAHRVGWDQPARLIPMFYEGTAVIGDASFGQTFPPLDNYVIRELAMNMTGTPPGIRLARGIAGQGFTGWAFVQEGWAAPQNMSPEQARADGRPFSEIPGSVETRMVLAVDVAGRVIQVTRVAGLGVKTNPQVPPAGPIFRALVVMTKAVASFMSPDDKDSEKLRELRGVTIEEALQQFRERDPGR